jgi:hypothetical protein
VAAVPTGKQELQLQTTVHGRAPSVPPAATAWVGAGPDARPQEGGQARSAPGPASAPRQESQQQKPHDDARPRRWLDGGAHLQMPDCAAACTCSIRGLLRCSGCRLPRSSSPASDVLSPCTGSSSPASPVPEGGERAPPGPRAAAPVFGAAMPPCATALVAARPGAPAPADELALAPPRLAGIQPWTGRSPRRGPALRR